MVNYKGGSRPSDKGGGGWGEGGEHPDPKIRGGGPPGPSPGSATALVSFQRKLLILL